MREIFRKYAAGKSYREIIKWLNDSGKRTKRGGCFGTNSLHDLLKNEKYIGNIVYGRSELPTGRYAKFAFFFNQNNADGERRPVNHRP